MSNITQEDIDKLVSRLIPLGKEIRSKADSGDELCKNIIRWYTVLYACPEAGALVAVESYLAQYIEKEAI